MSTMTEYHQLPLFEDQRIPKAKVAFNGSLELHLYNEDDRAIYEALVLGTNHTVALHLEGMDLPVQLDAAVTASTGTAKGGAREATKKLTMNRNVPVADEPEDEEAGEGTRDDEPEE